MNLGTLIHVNRGLDYPAERINRFQPVKRIEEPPTTPVKAASLQPVKPLLQSRDGDADRKRRSRTGDKLTKVLFWLFVFLMGLVTIGCGFGIQRVTHNRAEHRLGVQLRESERKRRQAELVYQNMHAAFTAHVAREQQQPNYRVVTFSNARPRTLNPKI